MRRFILGIVICVIGFAGIAFGVKIHERHPEQIETIESIISDSPDESYKEQKIEARQSEARQSEARQPVDSSIFDDDEIPRSIQFDDRYKANAQGEEIIEVANATGIADINDFPETVFISARIGKTLSLCTGVLIHREVILTARHCFKKHKDANNLLEDYETNPNGHIVNFGRVAATPPNFRIKSIAIYHGEGASDLALLRLTTPAPDNIEVAKFAPEKALKNATWMRVVGFGEWFTESTPVPEIGKNNICDEGEPVQGCKFFGEAPIATQDCSGIHPGLQRPDAEVYGCRKDKEIVAGRVALPLDDDLESIADTCKGDSGGPAFVLTNEKHPEGRTAAFNEAMDTGNYFLAGITSRAIVTNTYPDGQYLCGQGSGGIYSLLIGPAKQWIANELKLWGLYLSE